MVASHSRELPAIVGEFISGLVIGIIALVIVKGFKKIFGKKNNTIKIQILPINDDDSKPVILYIN
jgi:hypothetical protein